MAVYTAIDDPEAYFQVKTYTGNATDDTVITLDGDTDMQPALIWIKNSSTTDSHHLVSVPGTAVAKRLRTDTTGAVGDQSDGVKSIQSDGFTIGTTGSLNGSGNSIVAWCWKESATAGMDIDTYAGNTTSGRTEAHSLSAVPHVMIVKVLNNADNWMVYHHKMASDPETDYLQLNTTAAKGDSAGIWNDTAPTSSVFSLGNSGTVNEGYNYVAYLWSEKQGFSKFGSYTGNGDADGAFVYTGFKPAWLMVKKTNDTKGWHIHDNARPGYNPSTNKLSADSSAVEATSSEYILDLLSNGFKLRSSDNEQNGSGETWVYMAFAEAPLVNSNGVPATAR